MDTLNIIALILFPTVIALNVLIVRSIINRALNRFIKPTLASNGLTFIDHNWAGLFSTGDFKSQFSFWDLVIRSEPAIFVYVAYYDNNVKKRITVRIDTVFLFIQRVIYSNGLS